MLLGTVLIIIASVVGTLLFYKCFGIYARKEISPIDTLHCSQLFYACSRNQQVLIVLECFADALLQSGIGVYFPPLHIGNVKRIA